MVGFCAPERLEHLRYFTLLIVPTCAFYFFMVSISRKRSSRPLTLLNELCILAGKLSLLAYVAVIYYKFARGELSFLAHSRPLNIGIAVAVVCLSSAFKRNRVLSAFLRSRWTHLSIAAIVTAIFLLPSLQTSNTIDFTLPHLSNHLPYQLDEFAAAINGRTSLVDFFPQYQNLSPYLLSKVFDLIKLSIGSYTAVMAILSWFSLLLVYKVFSSFSGQYALLLYFPFLGLSFFPQVVVGAERATNFTYFSLGPMRYFGPWAILYLLSSYLQKPSIKRLTLLFLVSSVAVLNNLDFSFPALVGAAIAVLLTHKEDLVPEWTFTFKTLSILSASLISVFATFAIFTWFKSGEFPHWEQILLFQKTFALFGFFMMPMPNFGLQHLVYLTLMAALVAGFAQNAKVYTMLLQPERQLSGLLIFSGIYGLGAGMYYVGRSHPWTLIAIYPLAGFALMLLCWASFHCMKRTKATIITQPFTFAGHIVSGLLLGLGYFSALISWSDIPSPATQLARLNKVGIVFNEAQGNLVSALKSNTALGEAVIITYPYSHLLALNAGVQNLLPYSQNGSIILKSQIDKIIYTIKFHRIRKVFGESLPVEFSDALEKLGFKIRRGRQELEYWSLPG